MVKLFLAVIAQALPLQMDPVDAFVQIAVVTSNNANENGLLAGEFSVASSSPLPSDITVFYSLQGTAVSPADYQPVTGSLLIGLTSTVVSITITPEPDLIGEGNESVIVTLTSFSGTAGGASINIDPNPAQMLIIDENQDAIITVQTNVAVSSTDEGDFVNTAQFELSIDNALSQILTS